MKEDSVKTCIQKKNVALFLRPYGRFIGHVGLIGSFQICCNVIGYCANERALLLL